MQRAQRVCRKLRRVRGWIFLLIVLCLEGARDLLTARIRASVKPSLRLNGWYVGLRVDVVRRTEGAARGEHAELLCVDLLDITKTAKLTLNAVEVAVVIGIARYESIATDRVVRLDALDHLHGKR